ncbi:hypothetical protein BKA93DRAFT_815622 [Sparassis latifolia]|uniref:Uncharacterized protein n=1 Tax=Sparassis crispa TaxID=139825 RepID=A0A401GKF3_9APHY|nr:hypothetical protein SCP_0410140 [Sparassis crispa]GBE82629.1 hypothetical protein SCP_0410140 [Sparassis crispa]
MSQPVLASFDPLATHPFTNNSGLLPKPAAPSQFPLPISSSLRTAATSPSRRDSTAPPLLAPQPTRASPRSKAAKSAAGSTHRPIFVPFRPERSSPELDDILLRKKFSDIFANKQSWSIDQAVVPLPSHSAQR